MVSVVAGTETDDKVRQRAIVSVHTFADSMDTAEWAAQITHQRMLLLGPPLAAPQAVTITLPDNTTRVVKPDSIVTNQIPLWADYEDDEIFRFVARYEIWVRIVANT